jgi:hypothetical protein
MAIQTGVAIQERRPTNTWAAVVGAIVIGVLLAVFAAGALTDRGATQAPLRNGPVTITHPVQYPRAPYRAPQAPATYPRASYRAPQLNEVNAAHASARG